ncbi:MAG: hypothetical protein K5985_01530 [Lachnospiraceae bacterium]|nr:hypothetical protein [Lachnospiraceae bacterium]
MAKPRKEAYMSELIFNLNRFVEDSAASRKVKGVKTLPENCFLSQAITGDYQAFTALYAEDAVLTAFAAKYSKFELDHYDSIVNELAADFMNLHNGLFLVNLSDTEDVESTLEPPVLEPPEEPFTLHSKIWVLPVDFSFGTVNFVLSE